MDLQRHILRAFLKSRIQNTLFRKSIDCNLTRGILLQRYYSTRLSDHTTKSSATTIEELDKPIRFTTSSASSWKAIQTHGNVNDYPWYQVWSIIFSISAFLIYFGILREENDLDAEMNRSLWEKIPGLEKEQLKLVLKYNTERGLPVEHIQKRMVEIREQEEEMNK